jgi:putative transcriptional regulator
MTSLARGLALTLVVAGGAVTHARVPDPPPAPARSLTGQLLVATDELRDPRFVRTVVYMVRHDATGALGFIVNRPVGSAPLARILESLGRPDARANGELRVHYGGPVEQGRGFVLHTADWSSAETRPIRPGIALTSNAAVFEAIADGGGPKRLLFAVGYAGWSGGQLEDELQRGAWTVVDADEDVIFDHDTATKWDRAMARRRLTL